MAAAEQFLGIALIVANNYSASNGLDPLPGTCTDALALQSSLESLSTRMADIHELSIEDIRMLHQLFDWVEVRAVWWQKP